MNGIVGAELCNMDFPVHFQSLTRVRLLKQLQCWKLHPWCAWVLLDTLILLEACANSRPSLRSTSTRSANVVFTRTGEEYSANPGEVLVLHASVVAASQHSRFC